MFLAYPRRFECSYSTYIWPFCNWMQLGSFIYFWWRFIIFTACCCVQVKYHLWHKILCTRFVLPHYHSVSEVYWCNITLSTQITRSIEVCFCIYLQKMCVVLFSGLLVADAISKGNRKLEIRVTSGSAFLHFYSDSAYNMSGFEIRYRYLIICTILFVLYAIFHILR